MTFQDNLRHGQSVNSESVYDVYEYDPYRMLASEIVISAVEDWRTLICERAWEKPYARRGFDFDSIRWFFKIKWCGMLMQNFNTTPEIILKMLEAELEDAKNAGAAEMKKIRKQHRTSKGGLRGERIRQRDLYDNRKSKGNK